jgi:hypothetical protein
MYYTDVVVFEWPRSVLFIMKFLKWPREPIMTAVFDEIHNQFPNMTETSWSYRLRCFTMTFNAILVITYVGRFTGHSNEKQNIPNVMDKPWRKLLTSNRINFKWIASKWMVKQLLVFAPPRVGVLLHDLPNLLTNLHLYFHMSSCVFQKCLKSHLWDVQSPMQVLI